MQLNVKDSEGQEKEDLFKSALKENNLSGEPVKKHSISESFIVHVHDSQAVRSKSPSVLKLRVNFSGRNKALFH